MSATDAVNTRAGSVTGDTVRPAILIRIENLAILAASPVLYWHQGGNWLLFAVLFLAFDLSMVGYLAGPRIGAFVYNLGHMYAGPALLGASGVAAGSTLPISIAIIWAAHIAMDRTIGYGLKYATGFKNSHISRI